MPLVLITAPADEPVSLAEARLHLRLDASGTPATHPDDDLVTALIAAARQNLDGADGVLGRALITQTWELRMPAFPCRAWPSTRVADAIRLPLPPLQSVTSIKYDDPAGVEQTLDSSLYVVGTGEPAEIVPAYGQTWPATRGMPESVRVRFVAGYGDAGSDVPGPILDSIKAQIARRYDDRAASAAILAGEVPVNYRIWSF